MFRPATMLWVDLLVDRDSVAAALDVLGRLQVIELQQYDRPHTPFEVEVESGLLDRLVALEQDLESVASLLPEPDRSLVEAERCSRPTDVVLPDLEQRCRDWLEQAKPLASRLRQARTRLEELDVLAVCLETLPSREFDAALLTADSSRSFPPFVALGTAEDADVLEELYGRIVGRTYPLAHDNGEGTDDDRVLVIGVTDTDVLDELERRFHSRGMRFVRVPEGLPSSITEALAQTRQLQDEQRSICNRLREDFDRLNQDTGMAGELWLLRHHRWVNETLADSLTCRRFVWLGGWVPEKRCDELAAALQDGGIPFLINREAAHQHGPPPVKLENPRWISRFETFVRGFGVPAANEVDPSPLLAVMTPLMFGYMFGDVGQGAILMLIGYLARRRFPILELLIVGGFSSVVFGFLYGSIFANEHFLPALWLRPMEAPLWILGIPVVFGFLAILASMLLSALQAMWRGRLRRWWTTEAPVVVLYFALPVALLSMTAALLLVASSMVWLLTAVGWQAYRKNGLAAVVTAVLGEIAELLEIVFQLVINTLSFARLGAFALAHAGLSVAVMALAEMPASLAGSLVVYAIGNAIVIALEGLVVSIQTTRLIMFEFFRRFLVGEGRPFQPLTLPHGTRLAS